MSVWVLRGDGGKGRCHLLLDVGEAASRIGRLDDDGGGEEGVIHNRPLVGHLNRLLVALSGRLSCRLEPQLLRLHHVHHEVPQLHFGLLLNPERELVHPVADDVRHLVDVPSELLELAPLRRQHLANCPAILYTRGSVVEGDFTCALLQALGEALLRALILFLAIG